MGAPCALSHGLTFRASQDFEDSDDECGACASSGAGVLSPAGWRRRQKAAKKRSAVARELPVRHWLRLEVLSMGNSEYDRHFSMQQACVQPWCLMFLRPMRLVRRTRRARQCSLQRATTEAGRKHGMRVGRVWDALGEQIR